MHSILDVVDANIFEGEKIDRALVLWFPGPTVMRMYVVCILYLLLISELQKFHGRRCGGAACAW
jgi:hypothetical protein